MPRPQRVHRPRPIGLLRLTDRNCSRYVLAGQGALGAMRSAEVTDIALAVFAVVLISALLVAFVSLH
jgi:hypothetical protein